MKNEELRGAGAAHGLKFISYRRDRACPCSKSAKVGSDDTVGRGLAPAAILYEIILEVPLPPRGSCQMRSV